jgi:hypothetical protein
MKKFKIGLVLGLALALAGCGDPNTVAKVGSYKVTPLGTNDSISGGASEGSYSGGTFGSSGYFRSYLNSDIARVPIKFEVTFSNQTGHIMRKKTFMYDVFLQRAEVIDIINNKSMKGFNVRYGSNTTTYESNGFIHSTVCYSLFYGDRLVEVEQPGNPARWCEEF